MLNFRDSFFPYLGLILFIVCIVSLFFVCVFVHTKRVIFWSIGNLIGFFLGYLIAFLATPAIVEKISASIDIEFITAKEASDMIAVIVEPIVILLICMVWNLLILLPVYFCLYKKWIGLHDINKYTDEVSSKYFHHKKGVIWSEKIAGMLISFVAFYPLVTMVAADTSSYLCSQTNINSNAKAKNVNNNLGFICSWNKNQELRQNIDGLQGILNLTTNNLDKDLYSAGSRDIYTNYVDALVHLLEHPLADGYFGTNTESWYSVDGAYYPNYDKIFGNSYFSKYSSYVFESKKMIDIFIDTLSSAMIDAEATPILDTQVNAFKGTLVYTFLCGQDTDVDGTSYHLYSQNSNLVQIPAENFKYLSDKVTNILFENPSTNNAIEEGQNICHGFFATY